MHDSEKREMRRLIAQGVREAIEDWWREAEERLFATGDTGIRIKYTKEKEDGVRTTEPE